MGAASSTVQPAGLAGKYLTIGLGSETYGIEILRVREIIRMQKITPVPQMPDYVKGVINLRGRVIPIVDLRVKLGFPSETAERTCVVLVQVRLPSGSVAPMGLTVDRVEEVINLAQTDIEPTPEFGTKVRTEYILGLAKVRERIATLLDIDQVVTAEVVEAIVPAAAAGV